MDRNNPFIKLYEHVTQRKVKLFTNYAVAPCPFHQDTQPSMAFYEDHVHCFGCGYHTGSVYRFARDLLGIPYGADITPVLELANKLNIQLTHTHTPRPQTPPPGGWLFAAAGAKLGVVYHYPELPRKLGRVITWPPTHKGTSEAVYSLWAINNVGRPVIYLLGKFSNPRQQLDIPVYLPQSFEDLRFYMYRLVYLPGTVLIKGEVLPLQTAITKAVKNEKTEWFLFTERQLATLAAYMLRFDTKMALILNSLALTRQAISTQPPAAL